MAGGSGRGHQHPIPPVPPARQHCWVKHTAENGGPHPGLVTAWQQRDGHWWARVTYLVIEADAVVDQWISANQLTPVAAAGRHG